MSGLSVVGPNIDRAFRIFDSYLDGPADHPVGVAVSGGGDSVALLYALALWGKRPLEVLCVDHGLNPASGQWTASVAAHAEAVDAHFTALKWIGDKPKTGLSAAARAARHALLADAARQKGIRVLCLAHTEDDIFEAQAMAEEGSNVATPAMWAPSPAWPDGRGVFLFRPFLGKRRGDLRSFLTARGVNWIDDPANGDRNSHRARVRQDREPEDMVRFRLSLYLQPMSWMGGDLPELLLDADTLGTHGMIVFDAAAFNAWPIAMARKRLAAAVVSAGGGNKLPRSDSVERLLANLASEDAQTLCGARVRRQGGRIEIVREAGELTRRGSTPMHLAPGVEKVWDGRFVVQTNTATVLRSSGEVRSGLSDADRAALQSLPAALRTVLPVAENGKQKKLLLANPSLTQSPYKGIFCFSWVLYRFLAASGAFACESDLCAAHEKAQ